MTERLGFATANPRTDTVPHIRLRLKPDRRQLSLGGTRRSTDDERYPYVLVYSALLAGHALLLLAFVAYRLGY